jgi:3-isopropylmalate/(R)-2-methylmalate dehydratase small subunit
MRRFERLRGKAVPLVRDNIDTDQIVPKQFLKRVGRSGFQDALFFDWRRREEEAGELFALDDPRYRGASILLAGENFGCGSSREHAVWALMDSGIRAVVAVSLADIFRSNALRNGLLAIAVGSEGLEALATVASGPSPPALEVDLVSQTISAPGVQNVRFEIEPHARRCLLEGLDEIALTLECEGAIAAHERALAWGWRDAPREAPDA